jgi:hypothetical protein
MDQLVRWLREHLVLDFQGDLDVDSFRQLVGAPSTPVAASLLGKVDDDRAVNDMLLVLADTMIEILDQALTAEVWISRLAVYADS